MKLSFVRLVLNEKKYKAHNKEAITNRATNAGICSYENLFGGKNALKDVEGYQ